MLNNPLDSSEMNFVILITVGPNTILPIINIMNILYIVSQLFRNWILNCFKLGKIFNLASD